MRITQWTGGSFDGLTLPKAERLVKYMLSEEFEDIISELYKQKSRVVMSQRDVERLNWNEYQSNENYSVPWMR
ncbi:MAG: hypothetical protein WAM14_05460 [Candidatus Nitrosopolaris sp.]